MRRYALRDDQWDRIMDDLPGPGSGYGAPGEAGVVQPVKVRPG
jgi:hypothetical protein